VYLGLAFEDRTWWGKSMRTKTTIYSTQEIYLHLNKLLNQVDFPAKCTHINIAVFAVESATPIQLGLFDKTRLDTRSLARASDKVNDRYGEFTLVPAKMANMGHIIIKRV